MSSTLTIKLPSSSVSICSTGCLTFSFVVPSTFKIFSISSVLASDVLYTITFELCFPSAFSVNIVPTIFVCLSIIKVYSLTVPSSAVILIV